MAASDQQQTVTWPAPASNHSPSPSLSPNPNPNPSFNDKTTGALSSQNSTGNASTKVSKRRSRATVKPPIRILSADKSNFRDMVQKLTGIPSISSPGAFNIHGFLSSASQSPALWGSSGGGGVPPLPLFKPMVSRSASFSHLHGGGGASTLPTLDTSSAYLPQPNLNMQHHDFTNELAFLQSYNEANFIASGSEGGHNAGVVAADPNNINKSSSGNGLLSSSFTDAAAQHLTNMPPTSLYNHHDLMASFDSSPLDLKSMSQSSHYDHFSPSQHFPHRSSSIFGLENFHIIKQAAELESLLMDNNNDKLDEFVPSMMLPHTLNSWFSSDGIHTPTPKMQIA